MANTLPFQDQCCTPCDEIPIVNVPGIPGTDGADGSDGANGENAFTTVTYGFKMPLAYNNVVVPVGSVAWASVGQTVFVEVAGYMRVESKNAIDNEFVLYNHGYSVNAASGTDIPSGVQVSPAGVGGVAGALSGAAATDIKGTYPNLIKIALGNAKGSLIAGNGTDSVAFGVGANNRVLHVDTTIAATNLAWKQVDLTTSITGVLPYANGGTNAITQSAAFNNLSPMTADGDLITRAAGVATTLPIGVTGTVLGSNGTAPSWVKIAATNLDATLGRSPVHVYVCRYAVSSGTAAATCAASTAWQVIPIAAPFPTGGDTGGAHVAFIAANQLTLQAGSYRVFGWCDFWGGYETHATRLRNITDNTTLIEGTPVSTYDVTTSGDLVNKSFVQGRFTLLAAKTIEFQYISSGISGVDKLGRPSSCDAALNEVYASLMFEVEAL